MEYVESPYRIDSIVVLAGHCVTMILVTTVVRRIDGPEPSVALLVQCRHLCGINVVQHPGFILSCPLEHTNKVDRRRCLSVRRSRDLSPIIGTG